MREREREDRDRDRERERERVERERREMIYSLMYEQSSQPAKSGLFEAVI